MNQRATPTPPAAAPETPQTRRVKDPTPGGSGQTTPHLNEGLAPRMPHERDESSDSGVGAPSELMRRAHDDAVGGKGATDKGEATDAVYRRNLRDRTPGTERD